MFKVAKNLIIVKKNFKDNKYAYIRNQQVKLYYYQHLLAFQMISNKYKI